jgi:hypothetical protein
MKSLLLWTGVFALWYGVAGHTAGHGDGESEVEVGEDAWYKKEFVQDGREELERKWAFEVGLFLWFYGLGIWVFDKRMG